MKCWTGGDPAQTASVCAQAGSAQLAHLMPPVWDATARGAAAPCVHPVAHGTCCVSTDQLYSTSAIGLMSPRRYKFTV